MLHRRAVRFKFPLLRIRPEWNRNIDRYTKFLRIHKAASGENGMRPDLIRRQFFSANVMYRPSSSSRLFSLRWRPCLDLLLLCASPVLSISLFRIICFSSSSAYRSATPGSFVFRRLDTGRIILGGDSPIKSTVAISMTKSLWSPIPYPDGITEALLIEMSKVAHIPSIGFEPQKNVDFIGFADLSAVSFAICFKL